MLVPVFVSVIISTFVLLSFHIFLFLFMLCTSIEQFMYDSSLGNRFT